jgi:hypothetical protein
MGSEILNQFAMSLAFNFWMLQTFISLFMQGLVSELHCHNVNVNLQHYASYHRIMRELAQGRRRQPTRAQTIVRALRNLIGGHAARPLKTATDALTGTIHHDAVTQELAQLTIAEEAKAQAIAPFALSDAQA